MSGMSTTEKGKVLSFEQKLEVYQQLNSGESFRKIAENFGMDVSTITDICRSRRHLMEKDEKEDIDKSDKANEELSHSKAYSCFKIGLEQQKEFSTTELMLTRHIRNVAELKSLSRSKQKFILGLFRI
ncbi:hypothetical protein T4D_12537 [Trichinella pseudospiralis]|uniref:HTH psq-type domain-containing protein n=1 Tax=Trichinella pseudospiralis TaxID=6337 RepID=A0A0V1FBX9_TRIPS|nr:hypothetical protein T4D_12537 [Trichinella pseudospiralis]